MASHWVVPSWVLPLVGQIANLAGDLEDSSEKPSLAIFEWVSTWASFLPQPTRSAVSETSMIWVNF